MKARTCFLAAAMAALLAGCGGGSSPAAPVPSPVSVTPGPTPAPTDNGNGNGSTPPPTPDPGTGGSGSASWADLAGSCAVPRTGVDSTNTPIFDRQGTLMDEKLFLKGWLEDTYLWYKELPNADPAQYATPIDYFNVMKTSAVTPSGKPKDQFHFTYPTDQWNAMQQSGVALGYGITWSRNSGRAPRYWFVSMVDPGSPAAAAGIKRGTELMSIDGQDFVNSNTQAAIDILNAGLAPSASGEKHRFGLRSGGIDFEVELAAADVFSDPVRNVKVLDTPGGKVGYLTFNSFNGVAERELIDAFTTFQQAGVSDLVLDLRYNGGGLVYLAGELAYMIAGPGQTSGKVFEQFLENDKQGSAGSVPFGAAALGFPAPQRVPAGTALPHLDLRHVTVLTTGGTCSASEAVVNGLRGVDVAVDLIGATTCGKPYAFTPMPNCGTTYFAVQIQGVNNKGFGDFADGFTPTCQQSDDLAHNLGDTNEVLLSTALQYRTTHQCPGQGARQIMLTPVLKPAAQAAVTTRP
ncbi:MAG: S41 family peptidase [Telluria sp.]